MTTQEQILDRLERRADRFEGIVRRALKQSIRAGTEGLGNVITAAITPEPVPDPERSNAEDVTSFDDLAQIGTAWDAELRSVLLPELSRVVALGGEDAINDVADALGMSTRELSERVPVLVDGRHPAAEVYLSEANNRLRGIGDDLWQKTRSQLVDGVAAGESIPKLASRVREELASTSLRARTIARTEVISASNAGSLAQVRVMPPEIQPQEKTWLATDDSRTRPTHRLADGQTVDLGQPFDVGGYNLDFPGDPTAPPQECINCRCTILWDGFPEIGDN